MALGIRARRLALFVLPTAVAAACVISTSTRGKPVQLSPQGATLVGSPVKAHLLDGSVVVYRYGVNVTRDTVLGNGVRYAATLTDSASVTRIPLDSVLGMETFERVQNPGRTLLYSTAATLATKGFVTYALANGDVSIIKAIFGSCPTIYSDSAGASVLEAESFSYSIAPLLEKRDVDRLRAQPDSAGVVRLEVRNEALETHYIDHLELLEVRHAADEYVLPASRGGPVAVRALAAPASARDRAGRDVRRLLAAADGEVFATDDGVLARAAAGGETEDHLDVTIPKPRGRDSVAVVLRMRSSLLTTVLFYDQMLAAPGAKSLDWMARDLARITTVAELARWYVTSVGLRVSVLDGGEYRQVARLVDFGPIAWRNVAAVVPAVGDGDSLRIRLSFLADQWRIDRLLVSADVRRAEQRVVPLARVVTGRGAPRADVTDVLRRADDRRLQTLPGDRFIAQFDAGAAPPATSRTFLLAAQGYYTEWVRGSWIKAAADSAGVFRPSEGQLARALRRWRAAKDSLEARFFEARVPVV